MSKHYLWGLSEVKSLSRVRLFATLWTVARQAPLSMGFSARILEWVTISFSRGSSQPRDQTRVSRIGGRRFNLWATREAREVYQCSPIPPSAGPPLCHPLCKRIIPPGPLPSGLTCVLWEWCVPLLSTSFQTQARSAILSLPSATRAGCPGGCFALDPDTQTTRRLNTADPGWMCSASGKETCNTLNVAQSQEWGLISYNSIMKPQLINILKH